MLFHWKLVENITKCTPRATGACHSSLIIDSAKNTPPRGEDSAYERGGDARRLA